MNFSLAQTLGHAFREEAEAVTQFAEEVTLYSAWPQLPRLSSQHGGGPALQRSGAPRVGPEPAGQPAARAAPAPPALQRGRAARHLGDAARQPPAFEGEAAGCVGGRLADPLDPAKLRRAIGQSLLLHLSQGLTGRSYSATRFETEGPLAFFPMAHLLSCCQQKRQVLPCNTEHQIQLASRPLRLTESVSRPAGWARGAVRNAVAAPGLVGGHAHPPGSHPGSDVAAAHAHRLGRQPPHGPVPAGALPQGGGCQAGKQPSQHTCKGLWLVILAAEIDSLLCWSSLHRPGSIPMAGFWAHGCAAQCCAASCSGPEQEGCHALLPDLKLATPQLHPHATGALLLW